MRPRTSPACASLLLLFAPAAAGQILLSTGDDLPGLGPVAEVLEVAINDAGDWAVTVRTAGMATGANALVVNGDVRLAPGDALPGDGLAATFQRAEGPRIDAEGRVFWRGLGQTAQGLPALAGLFRDLEPLAKTGAPIFASGVAPGTNWSLVSAHEPLPGGGATFRARTSAGTDTFLWRVDELPGGDFQVELLDDFPQPGDPNGLAVDGQGRIVHASGSHLWRDDELLASEFSSTPIFGGQYGTFTTTSVAAAGPSYAFLNRAMDGRWMLMWNDQLMAREGDGLTSIAPFTLTELAPSPFVASALRMGQQGRTVWWGRWNDPDPERGEGLFLFQDAIVRVGESDVFGSKLTGLADASGAASFDLSPSSTILFFRAELEGGSVVALRAELKQVAEFIAPCTSAPLLLCTGTSGACADIFLGKVVPGGTFSLSLYAAGVVPGQAGDFFNASTLAQVYVGERMGTPCGLELPGIGELLLDLSQPYAPFATLQILPSFWATKPIQVPADQNLIGLEFDLQGILLNPSSMAAPIRLSNGLGLRVGLVL